MDNKNTIFKLQKQINRLKNSIKKERYGLVWMDVPEAFEDDVENKLPILKEVPDLAIKNDDKKPTHILIEGDNYHALTCLNYTHKGKIDIIYIDPPYNTGSDGFRYKDKRIISKFPDGTEVPKDHPFRHSYWLSFMRKRLELARDLLTDEGIIFISIDDNEVAQLRLLCDEIFIEQNLIASLIWRKKRGGGRGNSLVIPQTEYILTYAKSINKLNPFTKELSKHKIEKFKYEDNWGKYAREGLDHHSPKGAYERKTLQYKLKIETKEIYCPTGQWLWSQDRVKKELKNCVVNKNGEKEYKYLDIVEDRQDRWRAFKKIRLNDDDGDRKETILSFIDDPKITNNSSAFEIKELFGEAKFSYAKPSSLVKYLLKACNGENTIILDFFAGSGTTGHAVMKLNDSDKGNRQFILITNNEGKIMENVCYPRIKKVIKGYKNQKEKQIKGLGNSLKYYKTAFIGKNSILDASDEDKVELAHNAGELLAIAENTLETIKQTKHYQLFEDNLNERYTAIYFTEELDQFEKFLEIVEKLNKKTTVYVFSWGDNEFTEEFEHLKDVKVKTIPIPILEIYKNIYNLVQ